MKINKPSVDQVSTGRNMEAASKKDAQSVPENRKCTIRAKLIIKIKAKQ